MVWDKLLPAGSNAVNISDDHLRDNNTALETAFDLNFYFATGGTQSGEFRLRYGSNAARDTAIPSPLDGNLWTNDGSDDNGNRWFLQVYDSGAAAWEDVIFRDIGTARMDTSQDWVETQFATNTALTYGAGSFDWIDDESNAWKGTLTVNSTLENPTANLAGTGISTEWKFEFAQDAFGGNTLSYGTRFKPAFGAQPAIASGILEKTMIYVTQIDNGDLIYTVTLLQ